MAIIFRQDLMRSPSLVVKDLRSLKLSHEQLFAIRMSVDKTVREALTKASANVDERLEPEEGHCRVRRRGTPPLSERDRRHGEEEGSRQREAQRGEEGEGVKSPREVVELVEHDAVVREFADLYYIVRQSMRQSLDKEAPKLMAELKALGVDEHDAQEVTAAIDEEMGKILKELATNLRLPPKAELGSEPEEGVGPASTTTCRGCARHGSKRLRSRHPRMTPPLKAEKKSAKIQAFYTRHSAG